VTSRGVPIGTPKAAAEEAEKRRAVRAPTEHAVGAVGYRVAAVDADAHVAPDEDADSSPDTDESGASGGRARE
jgi:hypothetical protein